MLRVWCTNKLYDKKDGKLIGYIITDGVTSRNVAKDNLKTLVVSGDVDVANMTLTSDGRFIGHACKLKNEAQLSKSKAVPVSAKVVEIWVMTFGKKVVSCKFEFSDKTHKLINSGDVDELLEKYKDAKVNRVAYNKNKFTSDVNSFNDYVKSNGACSISLETMDKERFKVDFQANEKSFELGRILAMAFINEGIKIESSNGKSFTLNSLLGIKDIKEALKKAKLLKFITK